MAFFFLRKTVFIVTGTNRALVTGFFLFVTWKKENIWNMERSDRYLLKRYEKIHWYFVCKLEYRFSRILTREEPIWGLKRVFKRSTVFKTFVQISRRHFVKNQVTCVRYFGHMIKVSRTLCHSLLSFLVCVLRSDEVKFSRYMFVSIDRFLY